MSKNGYERPCATSTNTEKPLYYLCVILCVMDLSCCTSWVVYMLLMNIVHCVYEQQWTQKPLHNIGKNTKNISNIRRMWYAQELCLAIHPVLLTFAHPCV